MKSFLGRLIAWWRGLRQETGAEALPSAPPETGPNRVSGHFVQVGLDFGTAFLKCVCRDVNRDTTWVHRFGGGFLDEGFVVPAALWLTNGRLSRTRTSNSVPLPSLKLSLRNTALGRLDAPEVVAFGLAADTTSSELVARRVFLASTLLVGLALASVRKTLPARLRGFGEHPDDYLAVNMAVPVADAQVPAVNAAFERVLRAGLALSTRLTSSEKGLSFEEIEALIASTGVELESPNPTGPCYVYPEVSANVQGFVRSRVSSEGTYLFCDTGAGTVDQSVFIFHRHNGDGLTYLHASVLPLGSGVLERRAASFEGSETYDAVERLKQAKESGAAHPALDRARNHTARELLADTKRTLLGARKKLRWSGQLDKVRVIFGGGGHSEHPYARGVMGAFKSEIFSRDLRPDAIGMPVPADLELAPKDHPWMNRLSVAYGLSFERNQLTPFIYPREVEPPSPDELWRPRRRRVHAPSKDEV